MTKYKKLKLKDGTTIDEHRYIMEQHLGRKLTSNEIVHHIDGNGRNNKLNNLKLTTRSEHSREHWFDGTYKHTPITEAGRKKLSDCNKGENSSSAKLTEAEVIKIKHMLQKGMTPVEISKFFDISRKTISNIKCGNIWKHIII